MKKWMIVLVLMAQAATQAQDWNKNLETAIGKAGREDKQILLLFSVPDACAICEQLEKNVLQSEEFKVYAAANLVLAKPDFSGAASFETKADNLLIVEKYNKDGFFPLVVILDKNAKVIGKAGIYNNETPEQYIKILKSITKDR